MRRGVLAAVLCIACGADEAARTKPASEPRAPSPPTASVVDLKGATVDVLPADAPATVLLFVSTHCPISNRYAPSIREHAQAWAEHGVATWLVYPDPEDQPEAIAAHQAEFSLQLPTVRDPEHALVAMAGARVTPEAAVFGAGSTQPAYVGRIDDRVVEFGKVRGQASAHELRDAVSAVRQGTTPTPAAGPAIGCYISDLK